jgi:hypothetical protein
MGGSHHARTLDDRQPDPDPWPDIRMVHPCRRPHPAPPPHRGRPRLREDLDWVPLCHALIERHRANPTHSWAALARGRGIHPRTLYNWRQEYEWLEHAQPDRLRRAIAKESG